MESERHNSVPPPELLSQLYNVIGKVDFIEILNIPATFYGLKAKNNVIVNARIKVNAIDYHVSQQVPVARS